MVQNDVTIRSRHEDELAALFETAAQLPAQLEVETVLQTIVDRARTLIGTDLSYITLLDRENRCVRMRVATGARTPGFMDIVLPLGAGLGGVVARDVQPIYTSDYLNDPRFEHDPQVDRAVRLEGIRSILGVPLTGRTGDIGVLYVANRWVNTFTDANVELLSALGHHAALALENARLYEEAVRAARVSEEAKAIAEAHYRDLALVNQVHQKLTDVLLAGEGIAGVASSLATTLDVGICITDRSQFVLAQTTPRALPQQETDSRGCLPERLLRHSQVRNALVRASADYQPVLLAGLDRVLCPVAARQELLGFIWAALPARRQPTDVLRTSLEQAARAVALELLRERATVETEARLRREFLDELLSTHAVPPDVLRHRARQVWQSFAAPHRPFICRIAGDQGADGTLLERAREVLAATRPGDFVAIYGDRLIGLLPIAEHEVAAVQVQRIQRACAQRGLLADIVVGGVCRSFDDDRHAITQARRLQDLVAVPGRTTILWLERLEVLLALFEPSTDGRLDAFVDTTLGPVLNADSIRHQLLGTLDAYYQCLGNRAQAARRLGIHINTLYKRLDRLNELVGPLDDPVHAVPLQVALLAWTTRHPM